MGSGSPSARLASKEGTRVHLTIEILAEETTATNDGDDPT